MPGPIPRLSPPEPRSRVWVTLITRASYLPGVVLLVRTLYKHQQIHPIIIQYTSSLEEQCIDCLKRLITFYPLSRTQFVDSISLPKDLKPVTSRFDDTMTKLRVFEPFDKPTLKQLGLSRHPEQCCFLDADITIFRNMDDVFDILRQDSAWIAARHACVCNIDNDSWAAPGWSVEDCALTPLKHPSALQGPVPSSPKDGARPTYRLLKSGFFVCTPFKQVWDAIEDFRLNDPHVRTFAFPDQNFLDVFFKDRWVPIGWQYNALKTSRYWHPSAWRDEEVRALHYIVGKPWERRNGSDGKAGYLGRDGVTHRWWWEEHDEWECCMEVVGGQDVLDCVRQQVAPPKIA